MNPPPKNFVSGVLVTPRLAYLLESSAGLSDLRTRVRGRDAEIDVLLRDIREVAMHWAASVNVSDSRKSTEAVAESKYHTPASLTGQLHIGEAAIRLACRQGKFPGATLINGRWHIPTAALILYKRARSS